MSALTLPTAAPVAAKPVAAPTAFRVALYEGAGSDPLLPADRAALLGALLAAGHAVTVARPGRTPTPPATGTLVVLGRFADAPPATADGGAVSVTFRDITNTATADVVARVDADKAAVNGPAPAKTWKPWFPVIDYDRCTNCMQCLSFCLFDVYGVSDDKKIQVQNQSKCKTDCPACSRVCPEVAILFPKYRHGPINGDVVSADDTRREVMKVDISALLGGDIYQALRDRSIKSRSRFAKERDDTRALEERQRCLAKLGEKLDIPAEVFTSLPTADEIRAKADAAKARGAAALADAATATATGGAS